MDNIKVVIKKVISLFQKYQRFVYVAGLFVVMTLVLYFLTGEEYIANREEQKNNKPVSGEDYVPDKEFKVDAYEEVNELIATYFGAYVEADFDTLSEIATPISEMEMSYITTLSQFYEEYQNIVCYTKQGLSKDSYIVSACFDIKFADSETLAPSMMLFYVQTNEDGEVYINNLYSDFNMQYSELAINRDVYTALRKYTTETDYLELYNEVETAFNQLIKEDEEIYILTKRTIPAVRQEWEDEVYYYHGDTEESSDITEDTEEGSETDSSEMTETETTVTEETEIPTETESEPESTEPQEPVVEKVKVRNNNTNVRSSASTSASKLGQVDKGTILEKLGEENGWTKVKYDNQIGYIKSSLLDEVTE